MPDTQETFEFVAPLEQTGGAAPAYIVVVPYDVGQQHGQPATIRVRAQFNGSAPQPLALNSLGNGQHYLRIGRPLHKALGQLPLGSTIQVKYQLDDPEAVDIPGVLQAALAQEPEAAAAFQALTPGRRRSIAYYVSSARSESLQIKRSLELVQGLLANGLKGWPAKGYKSR